MFVFCCKCNSAPVLKTTDIHATVCVFIILTHTRNTGNHDSSPQLIDKKNAGHWYDHAAAGSTVKDSVSY